MRLCCSASARRNRQRDHEPVIVATTKTERLGETTADVSVVTREQIEKMPANNVLDVMRTMPGVTVDSARSFYGTSTQNKVIIRGMGGDDVNGRVLVLMDGLPVMTAGNNIFNWDTISLDTVERIEVVRGPASALYGSSAMGGVINIITRKPTEEGFKTTVGTKFGRYNTWQNKLYHTGAIDNSYAISGSMLSRGPNVPSEHSPKPVQPERIQESSREDENYNGALALNYRFDETADLSIHGERPL
ncbi:MAG: TonB-dependent receptor [Bilophila wadsworthia]